MGKLKSFRLRQQLPCPSSRRGLPRGISEWSELLRYIVMLFSFRPSVRPWALSI